MSFCRVCLLDRIELEQRRADCYLEATDGIIRSPETQGEYPDFELDSFYSVSPRHIHKQGLSMSKFLSLLESVGQESPTPLGFGIAARRESRTPLACVGILRKPHPQMKKLLAVGCLDGVLIAAKDGDAIDVPNEAPWGIWPDKLSVEGYKEKGCDFVVAYPQQLPAGPDDDLARFLVIEPDMDDRFLRTIEDLPVDGVLLTSAGFEPPINVQHLMTIGMVRTMFEKHLLVEVSVELQGKELELLRDMGVVGIAIDLQGLSVASLRQLGQHIKELPQRRLPQGTHGVAPYLPSRPVGVPDEDDDEEGEF